MEGSAQITHLLHRIQEGDATARDRLFAAVYGELRRAAHDHLRRGSSGGQLHTTALVHEAYLKLFEDAQVDWQDRAHFFALSSRAMRQVLVDHFRRTSAEKRGGARPAVSMDADAIPVEDRGEVLLNLDRALTRLACLNARLSQVVEYKFFGGMTQDEIARVLGVTGRTVRSDWRKAKAWLACELSEELHSEAP